jgi:hypothetical protein
VKGLSSIPIFDMLVKEAKAMGEDFLNICEKTGDIKIANVSFTNSYFASQWPAGDYKNEITFFDDIDKNIWNMTFLSHITKF